MPRHPSDVLVVDTLEYDQIYRVVFFGAGNDNIYELVGEYKGPTTKGGLVFHTPGMARSTVSQDRVIEMWKTTRPLQATRPRPNETKVY